MAKHMVTCRVCGQRFDAEEEPYHNNGRAYYHARCFQERESSKSAFQKVLDYNKEICGSSFNFNKTQTQLKKYEENGTPAQDVLDALKYWYEVRGNDPSQAHGGIGIVGYIIDDSRSYWRSKEEEGRRYDSISENVIDDYRQLQNMSPPTAGAKRYYTIKPRNTTTFILD